MMRRVLSILLAVVCSVCLVACTDTHSDGIVIVPSQKTDAAAVQVSEAADVQTEAAQTEAASQTAAASETLAGEPVRLGEDAFLEQARKLYADAAYLAYLDRYDAEEPTLAVIAALLAYQSAQTPDDAVTTEVPTTDAVTADAVFWTDGGTVWHVTASCSALARSQTIHSGSVSEAQATGKSRACKRCAP